MLPRIGRDRQPNVTHHNSSSLPLPLMSCTLLLEPTTFCSLLCIFPTLQMSSSSSPLVSPRRSHPQAFLNNLHRPSLMRLGPLFMLLCSSPLAS
ncbi:hypothetical protein CCMA1212_009863 [Trichoderma ghanense]|uniref:Uncharacterized protein n=1 Tax=Trichoderma ghanense TaxID=65468 RepID=A0ABY2GSI2_9HYPO